MILHTHLIVSLQGFQIILDVRSEGGQVGKLLFLLEMGLIVKSYKTCVIGN
uniref:Uncharacterized protein n=1 Tax=Rhizophora mucronata TaxID=61149 RepID=A0A2P2QUA8_RHIMU